MWRAIFIDVVKGFIASTSKKAVVQFVQSFQLCFFFPVVFIHGFVWVYGFRCGFVKIILDMRRYLQ